MSASGFDDRWTEIRNIHKEYKMFYYFLGATILLLIGFLVGKAVDTPDNTAAFFGILLGVAAGLATNLASWWILFHGIAPKIQFSSYISKTPQEPFEENRSGYSYRIKLINSGRRAIIDVEIMARLRILGVIEQRKRNWRAIIIPVKGSASYRNPRMSALVGDQVLELSLNDVEEFLRLPIYPDEIRRKAEQKTLVLEDLLSLGQRATLQIAAFGYDEFSGARKLFVSKSYTLDDIREGLYRGLDI